MFIQNKHIWFFIIDFQVGTYIIMGSFLKRKRNAVAKSSIEALSFYIKYGIQKWIVFYENQWRSIFFCRIS